MEIRSEMTFALDVAIKNKMSKELKIDCSSVFLIELDIELLNLEDKIRGNLNANSVITDLA